MLPLTSHSEGTGFWNQRRLMARLDIDSVAVFSRLYSSNDSLTLGTSRSCEFSSETGVPGAELRTP